MKPVALCFVSMAIFASTTPARAQQPPSLPSLPPPATGAAPSTLNPDSPPPPPAAPAPLPSVPPVAAPAGSPSPPAPPSAPSPPVVDATTAAPASVTQVASPQVAPPAEPPPPIDVTGHGTFRHDGFYFRARVGGGALSMIGSGPYGTVHVHGAAYDFQLAFGGTPARGLVVGGMIGTQGLTSIAWSGITGDLTTAILVTLAPFVDWFPDERRGWHVGGQVGIGGVDLSANGMSDRNSTAVGGEIFGGYDTWIGPQFSLGLVGGLTFATKAKLTDDNQNDSGYSIGSIGATLDVTLVYH